MGLGVKSCSILASMRMRGYWALLHVSEKKIQPNCKARCCMLHKSGWTIRLKNSNKTLQCMHPTCMEGVAVRALLQCGCRVICGDNAFCLHGLMELNRCPHCRAFRMGKIECDVTAPLKLKCTMFYSICLVVPPDV